MTHQLAMTGEDWLSESDRKRQSRARGADDSGTILSASMREYAGWLESVFSK